MKRALEELPAPVLAYCRSGARSRKLAEMAGACAPQDAEGDTYDLVIVGGGSAGIATAPSILRPNPALNLATVEPTTAPCSPPARAHVGPGYLHPAVNRPWECTRHPEA